MNQNEDNYNEEDFFELYQDLFEAMMKGMQEFLNNNSSIMTKSPYYDRSKSFTKEKKQHYQHTRDQTNNTDQSKHQLEKTFDLFNTKKEISITLEIPNVNKKDIDLTVTRKTITLNLENKGKTVEKKIPLPSPVKPKTTIASYKNGILDIVIQKELNGVEVRAK